MVHWHMRAQLMCMYYGEDITVPYQLQVTELNKKLKNGKGRRQ